MTDESPALRERLRGWRLAFRGWRGTRPFWAGLLTILGGVPIAYFPYADLKIGQMTVRMATTAGAGALIIGILLITLGLTMWFHHVVRVFAGVASIVLALVSIPISNLGGFLLGFLLSMSGGALAVAWAPGKESGEDPAEPEGRSPQTEPDTNIDDLLGRTDSADGDPFPPLDDGPRTVNAVGGRHRG
ncbi:DUF6114 domain-containing protein [Streptomyces boninensis]|uniref:DUF6114 domain-containing protein n=1 Tax=Streptomyces boninensis TaxID=2039455 RepID=UPI003B222035